MLRFHSVLTFLGVSAALREAKLVSLSLGYLTLTMRNHLGIRSSCQWASYGKASMRIVPFEVRSDIAVSAEGFSTAFQ